jgi:hypothetical protein
MTAEFTAGSHHPADDRLAVKANRPRLSGKDQPDDFPTLEWPIDDQARAGAREADDRTLERLATIQLVDGAICVRRDRLSPRQT